jgi:hypothetical protein
VLLQGPEEFVPGGSRGEAAGELAVDQGDGGAGADGGGARSAGLPDGEGDGPPEVLEPPDAVATDEAADQPMQVRVVVDEQVTVAAEGQSIAASQAPVLTAELQVQPSRFHGSEPTLPFIAFHHFLCGSLGLSRTPRSVAPPAMRQAGRGETR